MIFSLIANPLVFLLSTGLAFLLGMACGWLASPWRQQQDKQISEAWWEGYHERMKEEKRNLIKTGFNEHVRDTGKN